MMKENIKIYILYIQETMFSPIMYGDSVQGLQILKIGHTTTINLFTGNHGHKLFIPTKIASVFFQFVLDFFNYQL